MDDLARKSLGITTGTFTAKIKELPEPYVGSPTKMKLYLDPQENRYIAMATQDLEQTPYLYRSIVLRIPDQGDVVNRTYKIDNVYENLDTAKATFWMHNESLFTPYIATSGEVVVTLNVAAQEATCTFQFNAFSPSKEELTVTDGAVELKGFDPSRSVLGDDTAIGSFTADISGHITHQYEANNFTFAERPANEVIFPKEHYRAWSGYFDNVGIPNRWRHSVTIYIAKDLGPGTYELNNDRNKIYVLYMDSVSVVGYDAISGSFTITSITGDSLEGTLDNVTAESSAGTIAIKNGKFSFERVKRQA
ncbi:MULTISPECIES: hypothetical protein [Pseudomonas]|uniref:hypothetical protein n=1 Tax=Pseudomonas TaxID=286 RepID=UPI00194F1381|nr:hypothetical protein [Pseudomonas sp. 008]GID02826.1 hypothetical protein TMM008_00280 [Pseudomonas sp. 008]